MIGLTNSQSNRAPLEILAWEQGKETERDERSIDHVARVIATEAKSPKLVVEKSTVPARTGQAGLGFGGFCFPKDLQAFVHLAERSGIDFSMLKEAEKINKRRIDRAYDKLREALWVVRGKRVGVLGLAFKPNTDDIRFAPAIDLVHRLLSEGMIVCAYDPEAMDRARAELPEIEYAKSPYEAAKDAEALVVATEWDEFRKLDWDRVRDAMARPFVLDGRNLLSPREMKARGFEYRSFGRSE